MRFPQRCRGSFTVALSFALLSLSLTNDAAAEKILLKTADWEVFTDGRVGGFLSYVRGDALPRAQVRLGPDGTTVEVVHDVVGGGLDGVAERQPRSDIPGQLTQGTLENMRVRSGFIGNTLGLGTRTMIGNSTATTYIQIWAFVESEARRKYRPNPADLRQGYAKLEGKWGSVLAGRSRALFSRGATDINVLYAHRFGLGFPGNVDNNGPAAGHIGFGVLGSGFAAGIAYATPILGGLQLTVGAYDPIQLQGAWTRTKWVRPEAELTFERALGTLGKIVLFGNGAYQKLYKPDSTDDTTAAGFGYGGRIELGPVRLGGAGHYGKGLGLSYALEASDATLDPRGELRTFDGYYLQSQVVLGRVDLSAGWGMTRVFLNPEDNVPNAAGDIPHSIIKYQRGISGGVVYHVTPSFHLDLDVFQAKSVWFLGEKQVVNIANVGMTLTW